MSGQFFGPLIVIPQVTSNMTGTAVLTSKVLNVVDERACSFQAIWTGTPVGVFTVQGSLNYSLNPDGTVRSAGTWDDLGVSLTAPAGAAGHGLVDISITGVPFIRIIYTNASGTGTLVAYGHAKGV